FWECRINGLALIVRLPRPLTLFPYTTLFRSNRKLAGALVKLAPSGLAMTEIPIGDLPLYSWDYDTDYPAVAREFKESIAGVDAVDRKSTRLNSSHVKSSYAVFCLKKKINQHT